LLVVLSYYRQSPQWQSHSCSKQRVVMIAVVCFISVLYMQIELKSRLFDSIASRISTSRNSFAVTVWAVFDSDPRGRHKSYHFVFAGFVPTVTFDSMLHNVSLTYIYNAIALQKVYMFWFIFVKALMQAIWDNMPACSSSFVFAIFSFDKGRKLLR